MTSEIETGQLNRSAADVYETFFVPALFAEWPERVLAAAGVQVGNRLLDVACGTGVLARAARESVGRNGAVTGVDANENMLSVASRLAPDIEWRRGEAEALPFETASFDVVACQFGLMFFTDRERAIREMLRVLRPRGRLAVAVWDSLNNTPGYLAMAGLLERLFGAEIAGGITAPYNLGDAEVLHALLTRAGASECRIETLAGRARFPSIERWVHTDVKGWTLADRIDETQYRRLLTEAELALQDFVAADGTVTFVAPAHVVTVTKG